MASSHLWFLHMGSGSMQTKWVSKSQFAFPSAFVSIPPLRASNELCSKMPWLSCFSCKPERLNEMEKHLLKESLRQLYWECEPLRTPVYLLGHSVLILPLIFQWFPQFEHPHHCHLSLCTHVHVHTHIGTNCKHQCPKALKFSFSLCNDPIRKVLLAPIKISKYKMQRSWESAQDLRTRTWQSKEFKCLSIRPYPKDCFYF